MEPIPSAALRRMTLTATLLAGFFASLMLCPTAVITAQAQGDVPPTLSGRALIGDSGPEEGLLVKPVHLAFDAGGLLVYVTDQGTKYIQVYDRQGKFAFRFGGEGAGPGELRKPTAVYFTAQDEVSVPDLQNSRINRYTKNGVFIGSAPIKSEELRGDLPEAIGGGLYVRVAGVGPIHYVLPDVVERPDSSTPLLEILNKDGEIERTMGIRKSSGDAVVDAFLNSLTIAVFKGSVAVVFKARNEIQVFTSGTGTVESDITRPLPFSPVVPSRGRGGRISADMVALGAAFDTKGRLWILTPTINTTQANELGVHSDSAGIMRLDILNLDGSVVATLPLDRPFDDIYFDPQGDLWLLDSRYRAQAVRYTVTWPGK